MSDYLVFALLGVGAGAVISVLGLAAVLGYRGSGVINFALGAVATYIAYTFNAMRTDGELILPIGTIRFGDSVALLPAFALAVVVSVLLGLLMHLLVFRPLRNAPPLAKVVSSIGLALVLQAIVILRFGPDARFVPDVLSGDDSAVELFGSFIPYNRFYLVGIVIVAAIALAALFRFTKLGLSMRAAAESEKGATLLGYSADFQAGLTWVMASLLAGVGGILLAPIVPLDPTTFTLLIVPALAAALVGNLTSFGLTVSAGIAIGMGQSVLMKAQQSVSWLPTGTEVVLPLVLLVAVLVVRGNALPGRGALTQGRLPAASNPKYVLPTTAISFAIGLVALLTLGGNYRLALIVSLTVSIIALSLVVLTGFVGQISLVQMALAGVAAFMLSRMADDWGIPFPLSPLLAAIVATLVGVIVALPALRIRGTQLAIVTLAAALTINELYFRNADLTGAGITSGATVPGPTLFGLDLGIAGGDFPRPIFGILVLVVLTVVALSVVNLRRSALGRQMLAVRDNEAAAAVSGINVASIKVIAFAMSAFIAGLGGALIGYTQGELSPASFTPMLGLTILAFAYLGGISSVSGGVLAGMLTSGGLIFVALDDAVSLGKYQTLIAGLGLIITAIANPEGISGAIRHAGNRVRQALSPSPNRTPTSPETPSITKAEG